eukprot:765852-Hanusia_phi.AAC.4
MSYCNSSKSEVKIPEKNVWLNPGGDRTVGENWSLSGRQRARGGQGRTWLTRSAPPVSMAGRARRR